MLKIRLLLFSVAVWLVIVPFLKMFIEFYFRLVVYIQVVVCKLIIKELQEAIMLPIANHVGESQVINCLLETNISKSTYFNLRAKLSSLEVKYQEKNSHEKISLRRLKWIFFVLLFKLSCRIDKKFSPVYWCNRKSLGYLKLLFMIRVEASILFDFHFQFFATLENCCPWPIRMYISDNILYETVKPWWY